VPVYKPTLFLVFINNLDVQAALVTIVRKFADDTKLAQAVRTDSDRELLQSSLDKLTAWADTWGMSFNVKKCMVMHFGHGNPKRSYYMNGEQLSTTKEERDIGVLVSDNLKLSAQCAKAARTAGQVLGQLSRAFHYRDRFTFIRLYKQCVLPHLEFSGQSWSPWTSKDKDILERVQRRAISMVSGLRSREYEERLKVLEMTTLEERRHQSDMLQVFKILQGHDNVRVEQWFKIAADGSSRTRMATGLLNLTKPRTKLEVWANFFSARVVDTWNAIPDKIKMAKNPGQFKRLYKAHRCGLDGE
jgi:ribonuclease P/MRP protein subunit RPP40